MRFFGLGIVQCDSTSYRTGTF